MSWRVTVQAARAAGLIFVLAGSAVFLQQCPNHICFKLDRMFFNIVIHGLDH